MKKLFSVSALLFSLIFGTQAQAAGTPPASMTASSAIVGSQVVWCPVGLTADFKCTFTQIDTFINAQFSGDATVASAGAVTLATVNSNVGSFGSATQCVVLTANAKGLITAASVATCTPAIASVTGLGTGVASALAIAPGTAGSFVTNGGALGTPSSGVATNLTGTAAGLTAGHVTTNANMTGDVTSSGNATTYANVVPAAKGGAGTVNGALKGNGAGAVSQAACADLSNGATSCSTDTTNASNISSGTLNTLRLPPPFTSGTKSGSSSSFGTTSGTLTSGHCVSFDASGNLVDAGAACGGSGSTGANPTATAGPTAVNGSATTFMRSDGAPAVQTATTSQLGLVQPDGSTIKVASGVISAPPQLTSRTVTGTTDTILSTDLGNIVYYNSASPVAVNQPAPSGAFANGFFTTLCNINTAVATVTPGSGTIGNASTYALPAGTAPAGTCASYQSDGTNFHIVPSFMINAALLTAGLLPDARLSSNVPLKNGNNVWTGLNTFGQVIGTVTTQSGTTYTFASTDCGTTVRFSNASAVTATIPSALTTNCLLAIEQAGAGKVSVNGSAVTPATLHSAHSYTGTAAQWSIINVFMESSGVAVLTGDGA